jgi:Domain of unknown function (DUF4352)
MSEAPGSPQQPLIPQGYALAPAPKKKNFFLRHKILTLILAIIVVAIIATATSGSGDDSSDSSTSSAKPAASNNAGTDTEEPTEAPAEEPGAAEAGIGAAVRDGKFEFTVTSLEPGVAQIGSEYLNTQAQGQFLLVHITVANIGDEAQMFDSSSQKLVDDQGRTHSADSGAAIYLDDSNSFLNNINPGNTVEGIIVFDIPVDAVPASIELHDSAFSGGVDVSLK